MSRVIEPITAVTRLDPDPVFSIDRECIPISQNLYDRMGYLLVKLSTKVNADHPAELDRITVFSAVSRRLEAHAQVWIRESGRVDLRRGTRG